MAEQPATAVEARGALLLALRQAGVRDVDVLRAIETVQREIFTPFALRDLAQRNCALPIACGQTMEAPGDLAAMLEALQIQPGHRVMEIGAGSGYSTAVLARLASEVVAFERFRSLSVEANARLQQLGVGNAIVHCADGLAAPETFGRFDRILAHVRLDAPDPRLIGALAPNGRLVCALPAKVGQGGDLCIVVAPQGDVWRLRPSRLGAALSGVAAAL
ncbi:MAG: protein-L-isoaspartate(D-aspartate) O-methyltransferase [Hyphomicrobiales bacterium]|nr:protein-L-isoaspartate(D-aspartate) O-methyltransferase [Rhodoblastus sp.]MCB1522522.1 protein-L-isoaspartate(D-aspartate) O-methyltransferase [Rhodoblastus sp.]MCC0001220.1 protein-L-isoaspartate(D-aspartate) O-methyltransferase [Methylobacteriaceae bacterium]MCC2105792.1 protein-L-isoaspartate(D-aspartate) O-methyltransferase [Hyphomicrobiales bacterium]HPG02133.1 rRNA adenine N-6-methyltransferase family protein [Rhodoblastus sp.]